MGKAGLIVLAPDTGKAFEVMGSAQKRKVYYIKGYNKTARFTYKGKNYRIKLFDGCFYPFVTLDN